LFGTAVFLACVAAAPPPENQSSATEPREINWTISGFLKGTPPEIRDTLQNQVEEFKQKTAEARREVEERKQAIARARGHVLATLRATAEYKRLLAESKDAERAMEQTRARGASGAEKVAAGSKFNKLRSALEGMEKTALARDERLADHRRRLAAEETSLANREESLRKARAWRDDLIDGIVHGFRMRGPLRAGSEGTLPKAKVVEVLGRNGAVLEYFADEQILGSENREGIEHLKVVGRVFRINVPADAVAGESLKAGDVVTLHQTFEVVGNTAGSRASDVIYVVRRKPAKQDRLLELCVPLKGT
jgi:hypothetical protein